MASKIGTAVIVVLAVLFGLYMVSAGPDLDSFIGEKPVLSVEARPLPPLSAEDDALVKRLLPRLRKIVEDHTNEIGQGILDSPMNPEKKGFAGAAFITGAIIYFVKKAIIYVLTVMFWALMAKLFWKYCVKITIGWVLSVSVVSVPWDLLLRRSKCRCQT